MHPLPLGKGDLKMKNDFWVLISKAEGDTWEYHSFEIYITKMYPLFTKFLRLLPKGI